MQRVSEILLFEGCQGKPADYITLSEEDRFRRHIVMRSDSGYQFLFSFPTTQRLRHRDRLLLEDGRQIEVIAALEPLYEVRAGAESDLISLAWHLGNRHEAIELYWDHIRIRQDPVIADMLVQMGVSLVKIDAHFTPIIGAYHAH